MTSPTTTTIITTAAVSSRTRSTRSCTSRTRSTTATTATTSTTTTRSTTSTRRNRIPYRSVLSGQRSTRTSCARAPGPGPGRAPPRRSLRSRRSPSEPPYYKRFSLEHYPCAKQTNKLLYYLHGNTQTSTS